MGAAGVLVRGGYSGLLTTDRCWAGSPLGGGIRSTAGLDCQMEQLVMGSEAMFSMSLGEPGGREACEEVAGTAQGKDSGEVGHGVQKGEREGRIAESQMYGSSQSHGEEAPREPTRKRTARQKVGEMAGLGMEHLSPPHSSPSSAEMRSTPQGAPTVGCAGGLPVGCVLPFHR